MSKRFYWLKLQKDFFKRHDIRIIEAMENGKDYIIFYLKLLTESISHEGALRFSDTIPYDEKMLSVITNTNIDIVRQAVKVFMGLHLMEIWDDATIYMTETMKMLDSESPSAERVRKHRLKKKEETKLLQCNDDVTKSNIEIDIEKELDKDIKKDTKKTPTLTKNKYGEFNNVRLTDDEYNKLADKVIKREYYIEQLSTYIEQSGKKYKSHYATILNWYRRDEKENKVETETFRPKMVDL